MLYWVEMWNDVSEQWESYGGANIDSIRMGDIRTRKEAEEFIRLVKIWDEVNTEFYGVDFTTEYRVMEVE